MKRLIKLLPAFLLLYACNDNDNEFEIITDEETVNEIDFADFLQVEKNQIMLEFISLPDTDMPRLALFARFTSDDDVTVAVEDLEVDLEFQPMGAETDSLFVAAHPLDELPLEPGDEADYEVIMDEYLFEGSIELLPVLEVDFPDTLTGDEPFEFNWESETDPQRFFSILTGESEEGSFGYLWELPGEVRQREFNIEEDFDDQEFPRDIFDTSLSLWSVNFDNFMGHDLVVTATSASQESYHTDDEQFKTEPLVDRKSVV